MTPYYADGAVEVYHGDCWAVLPGLPMADHVLTDPPYDAATHAGARTNAGGDIHDLGIDFDPLSADGVASTAALWTRARRWCVIFCPLELLGAYRDAAGDAWIRAGVWRRINATPQFTGDRPAQAAEGLAMLHRPGRKRWGGGGRAAYYESISEQRDRVHPTQKPERLMAMLIADFTDPGDLILDPFAGSGTTAIAAKRLGRRCVAIEREERHCASIARRCAQGALDLFGVDQSLFTEDAPDGY